MTKELESGTWSLGMFLNRDAHKPYTESGSNKDPKDLDSYLNFTDDTFLEAMENAKNNAIIKAAIGNFPDFSVPDIFNLFSPMRLQEHKLGFMGHYHTIYNDIHLDFRLPFLWVERNFNFTKAEKEKIYGNELLQMLGEVDEWAFATEYLISDQLGFGTLEATATFDIIKTENSSLQAGFSLFFPTEIALKKGLLGTYRELQDEYIQLKLADLISSAGTSLVDGWEEKIAVFFNNAFTRLTTNLLYSPLGFDHHPGVGVNIYPTWEINDEFTWRSSYEIQMLVPMYKNRLIVDKITSKTEVTDDFNAAATNAKKVGVIEIALADRLYPL